MDFGGNWYPAGREACRHGIEAYWEQAGEQPGTPLFHGARLGVAPHAGWMYSGRLAARGFQWLRPAPPVVAMTEGSWEPPSGPSPTHGGFAEHLRRLEPVRYEREGRYTPDNSTE